jgi:cation:H+ antiporter
MLSESFLNAAPVPLLFFLLLVFLLLLAKGADMLVEQAVALASSLGLPAVIIGATIVSLGTTLPEAAVSVMAALKGQPELALGNAVGSIICDAGLIIGIGALIRPLPIDPIIVGKQGWIQLAAGCLLVVCTLPFGSLGNVFSEGGHLPQAAGILLVILLFVYLIWSVHFAIATQRSLVETPAPSAPSASKRRTGILFLRLLLGIGIVLIASKLTIPTAQTLAVRLGIPPEVIAVTLVALGTSLPELVTVLTAVRKGRGDLAIGNVIGADILNVLFVAGLSAAATPAGLIAGPAFFTHLFPVMLLILVVFRIGLGGGRTHFSRGFGVLLLTIYLLFIVIYQSA